MSLTANQAELETSTAGWEDGTALGFTGDATRSTAQAHGGTASLEVVQTSVSTLLVAITDRIPAAPGDVVTATGWARQGVNTAGAVVQAYLIVYTTDSSDTSDSTVTGIVATDNATLVTLSPSSWTELTSFATSPAPAGTAWVRLAFAAIGDVSLNVGDSVYGDTFGLGAVEAIIGELSGS